MCFIHQQSTVLFILEVSILNWMSFIEREMRLLVFPAKGGSFWREQAISLFFASELNQKVCQG